MADAPGDEATEDPAAGDGAAPAPESTDEELFLRYVGGDEAAFAELFARYAPVIGRLVGRRVRDPDVARDLVQQAFLQLHRARRDFRPDALLRPWFFTIALNVVRRHYRPKRLRTVELDEVASHLPSVAPHDPVAAEAARALHAALERLPEAQREAVELHWLEGLSFAEVAEVAGCSTGAAKVRAHRGYEALRGLLAPFSRNQTPPSGTE
ncbi:MAG: RNA polymerase sigma factor [Deltaproteobacteria bacterium]|nr:RNA polymerase sigma factor [Deltaproteobacteria bacterium]